MKKQSRRSKSKRGNAMLELALGFSILWMLFSGVYQVGYAFYVYNVLMMSVTNAAELGSKLDYDTSTPAAFDTALKNMVVFGDTSAGTKAVAPNLTANNVNVNVSLDSAGIPRDVTITITGYSINALFTTYSLTNKPRATTLYVGKISCSSC